MLGLVQSTPLRLHSDHLARIVRWRALSGCCVATRLARVASPGSSNAWEMIPGRGGGGGGGIGGDTAAILPGLKFGRFFQFLS